MQGWKPRGSGAPGPPGPQQLIFSFSFFRARRLRFTALFPGRKDDASLLHKAYSHPSFTSPVWVGESFLSSDFQCFLLCSAGIISAAAPEASTEIWICLEDCHEEKSDHKCFQNCEPRVGNKTYTSVDANTCLYVCCRTGTFMLTFVLSLFLYVFLSCFVISPSMS